MSINGANRLGSNSLPELPGVRRAGPAAAAAEFAASRAPIPAQRYGRRPTTSGGGWNAICCAATAAGSGSPTSATEMQHTMEERRRHLPARRVAGQGRGQTARTAGTRPRTPRIEDASRTFNTALIATLELGFMLDVAETIVPCALRREESRGAHQRTDFPARDDERYLAHSLVYRDAAGSPRVDYLPVTITRWPPGERVYGR